MAALQKVEKIEIETLLKSLEDQQVLVHDEGQQQTDHHTERKIVRRIVLKRDGWSNPNSFQTKDRLREGQEYKRKDQIKEMNEECKERKVKRPTGRFFGDRHRHLLYPKQKYNLPILI